ncbi:MAG: transglycosylase domain-containing protein [Hyphomicrobiaceae bacterium]
MLTVFRLLTRLFELLLAIPIRVVRIVRFLIDAVVLNTHLGPFRHVVTAGLAYLVFAVLLVYVYAPIRGMTGSIWAAEKLRYDSERWLATAVYDRDGAFVGTLDPKLDSQGDFNATDEAIELPDTGYVANPDHKSIPVRAVPDYYWRCLVYHEDRNIGTWINPFGIDLYGVLKIPFSSIKRTIAAGSPRIGVGGSTLPMQLARVIYKTPPSSDENAFEKLRRKLSEWWDAPVIYWTLTEGGDIRPLQDWTANHLWLAQRTAGPPLHGVEMASRIVFGKSASELSIAEQFVLASAVNKPIILLTGSARLNAVREDRWRYIIEVRARKCASELLADETEQKTVWFELTQIAGGPPDPQVKASLQSVLEEVAPGLAKAAQANPVIRANVLIPTERYGIREEMKDEFGYDWRRHVRGVSLTLDVAANRRFRDRVMAELAVLQGKYSDRIYPGIALDPLAPHDPASGLEQPSVVIAAADRHGEIVRFFETGANAAYFGSPIARDRATGHYEPEREVRAIASIGKIVAAIGIANDGRDTLDSLYVDTAAPEAGLETCRKGNGTLTRGRKARVAFACSLNRPVEWRTARLGQSRVAHIIDRLGLTMPPKSADGEGTPPSTAAVRGFLTASPRKVHQMAGVVLASLTGHGRDRVRLPTLVRRFERSEAEEGEGETGRATSDIVPSEIIRDRARPMLGALLSAPLCYSVGKKRIGTLNGISDWCAERNPAVRLHFGKTGTQVTLDPNATVDTWGAGGIQFQSGAEYSYVVVVGTGNARAPWARSLHAAQVVAPLIGLLLEELKEEARQTAALAAAGGREPGVKQ